MKAKGLAWLGTRAPEFEATTRFFGGPSGSTPSTQSRTSRSVFRLPNGGKVEIFGPGDRDHEHFTTGPVAGFLVDDVEGARAELESAGISFIGPVHHYDQDSAWFHLVGPDGNVYEITRDGSRT